MRLGLGAFGMRYTASGFVNFLPDKEERLRPIVSRLSAHKRARQEFRSTIKAAGFSVIGARPRIKPSVFVFCRMVRSLHPRPAFCLIGSDEGSTLPAWLCRDGKEMAENAGVTSADKEVYDWCCAASCCQGKLYYVLAGGKGRQCLSEAPLCRRGRKTEHHTNCCHLNNDCSAVRSIWIPCSQFSSLATFGRRHLTATFLSSLHPEDGIPAQ